MTAEQAQQILAKYKYQIGVHNTADHRPDAPIRRGPDERAELKSALNFLHRHPPAKKGA